MEVGIWEEAMGMEVGTDLEVEDAAGKVEAVRAAEEMVGVAVAKATGAAHVPFKDSKLTHLMEPCLSGQGKTLMVVNVGPEADNAQETLCSLRFASQVNQCDVGGKPVKSAKPMDGAGGAP